MTHSHRRPTSQFEWFRMDVPKRHRAVVGKTSWQFSLETTDAALASILRAKWTAHYLSEVRRLDAALGANQAKQVASYIDAVIQVKSGLYPSLDRMVASELDHIALLVRASWSTDHARAVLHEHSISYAFKDVASDLVVLGCDSAVDRDAIALQAKLFERRNLADGIIHQRLAQLVLNGTDFEIVAHMISYFPELVADDANLVATMPEAVGREYIQRLATHRFSNWTPGIEALVAPLTSSTSISPASDSSIALPTPSALLAVGRGPGTPISVVFAAWRKKSKATEKSKDEFGSSLDRFIALHGDVAVEAITKAMVRDFRDMLEGLPARARKDVAALPIREQVERAKKENLPTLAAASVAKGVQVIRTALAWARDELDLIEHNVADGVPVEQSAEYADERLAFTDEQMTLIFSQPVMSDPAQADDDLFWFILLAPWTGMRVEEIAKLRPVNVREERGTWYVAVERDRKAVREQIAHAGGRQKRAKTKTSYRKIPIHSTLIDAGFLDLVDRRRAMDAEWLFDLRVFERYNQRGKYMSNKIMRHLRRIGITDAEYVFHSFRHLLKRELRDKATIKEGISDLLTGHSFSVSVGRKYARGAGLQTLASAIDQVAYPTVDWSAVTYTGRIRALS